ncbi:MAG: glycoside hydrolase family 16 protein [Spirochaetota bacterium]
MRTCSIIGIVLSAFFAYAAPPAHSKWELTFKEEFNGTNVEWNVWESERGYPRHILSSRWPENNVVSNGMLYHLIKKEKKGGAEWTSASIWTKHAQKYGYFECRYRYAPAPGCNNSFWLYSRDLDEKKRHIHEIDINEGHYPNKINATLHGHATWATHERILIPNADLSKEFHVYAAEWNEREIIWYFDDAPIRRISVLDGVAVASNEAKIYLSSAIIAWAGDGAVSDDLNGTTMQVDWVRAYKRISDKVMTNDDSIPSVDPSVIVLPSARRTTLLAENFESTAEGAFPAAWQKVNREPAVVFAHDNKVLKLTPPPPSKEFIAGDIAAVSFPKQTGKIAVSFRAAVSSPDRSLTVAASGAVEAPTATSFYSKAGPYLTWYGGKNQVRGYVTDWKTMGFFRNGAWMQYRIVIDIPAKKFDFYTGENERPTASSEFRTSTDEISMLFFAVTGQLKDTGTIQIDNISVDRIEE